LIDTFINWFVWFMSIQPTTLTVTTLIGIILLAVAYATAHEESLICIPAGVVGVMLVYIL